MIEVGDLRPSEENDLDRKMTYITKGFVGQPYGGGYTKHL